MEYVLGKLYPDESAGASDMSNVKVVYGDYAVDAKEVYFTPTFEGTHTLTFDADINQLRRNVDTNNAIAHLCHGYFMDGTGEYVAEDYETTDYGLWFESLPVTIAWTSEAAITSSGFTFTFDVGRNVYPDGVNIKWYQGETLLDEKDFAPDNAYYFCQNKIENFTKAVITLSATRTTYLLPYKLFAIDFGQGHTFQGDELKSVTFTQQVDNIAQELPINTLDFTIRSNGVFAFAEKQATKLYINNALIQNTYISSFTQKNRKEWEIKTQDYVSVLEDTQFKGGRYTDKKASELIAEILAVANVPYEITGIEDTETVTGWIPWCSCRQALQLVLFAVGANADTSFTNILKIYKFTDTVKTDIPLNRIRQGQKFKTSAVVTKVSLAAHEYIQNPEQEKQKALYTVKNAVKDQTHLVKFNNPIISATTGIGVRFWNEETQAYDSTTWAEPNYVKFQTTATGERKVNGFELSDEMEIRSKENPLKLANSTENEILIDDESLISENNIDNVLDLCYNHYMKNETCTMKIEDSSNTFKVGDVITYATEFSGIKTGRVLKIKSKYMGGLILKECEVLTN